jgi:epoxyqueuosine reductase
MSKQRPDIKFIPVSTDPAKIKFFGMLMPALLLLKASPLRFLQFQAAKNFTPPAEISTFIRNESDDAGSIGDVIVFVHRWNSITFDPFTFAHARIFLKRVTNLVRREGFQAEAFDPLTPEINLPKLAEKAGLGNLSPYGLLVHPEYGPRVILTGLRTDYPLVIAPRFSELGCTDCMSCIQICPQKPLENGIITLRLCQSCAKCLEICPTGKPIIE